jgi:hypothetical protein
MLFGVTVLAVAPGTAASASGCHHNEVLPGQWYFRVYSSALDAYVLPSVEKFTGSSTSACHDINAGEVDQSGPRPPCDYLTVWVQTQVGSAYGTPFPIYGENFETNGDYGGQFSMYDDAPNSHGYRLLLANPDLYYDVSTCGFPDFELWD